MKKRNTPREKKTPVKRERDPIPWRYCLLALFVGLLLAAGFFWAARQHFLAMNYGMKNAKLHEQKKSLEDEQGRLIDELENAHNPFEIKRLARKLGLQDLSNENSATVTNELPKTPSEKTELTAKAKQNKTLTEEENTETKIVKDKAGNLKTSPSRPQIAKK
jgi:hypothetical protein